MHSREVGELELARRACSTGLDAALVRLREGIEPDDAALEELAGLHGALFALLSRRNAGVANYEFREEDRVYFYVEALKLAALTHPNHESWPALAAIRRHVLDGLLDRLEKQEDPWLRLCAVTASLAIGSPKVALESFERIEADPFLRALAVRWANKARIAYSYCNDAEAYDAFLTQVSGEDPWNAPGTDAGARRWILLASIYPDMSVDPRTAVRDPRNPACARVALVDGWEITDRESALDMLAWLKTEGHSASVVADLAGEGGGDREATQARAAQVAYVAAHRKALARHKIVAWDIGRLIATARASLSVGYISEPEALELLDWAGQRLSETYASWEEFGDDYSLGCSYWEPSAVGRCAHCATIQWLKEDARSPWRRVPFHGRGGVEATVTTPPRRASSATREPSKNVLLEFPAEFYGMGLSALLLATLPPLGEVGSTLVGALVPGAFSVARDVWFPDLFPTPRPQVRLTLLRKIGAYAQTIFGGLVALLFGLFFYAGATEEKPRGIAWPILMIAVLGFWLALRGLRKLRFG